MKHLSSSPLTDYSSDFHLRDNGACVAIQTAIGAALLRSTQHMQVADVHIEQSVPTTSFQ